MPVEIKIWHDDASQALAELRVLSGGLTAGTYSGPLTSGSVGAVANRTAEGGHVTSEPTAVAASTTDAATTSTEEPARRKRRTKSEMAAANATEVGAQAGTSDTADTEAQDAADEQAESEASKKELSRDDVRAVLGKYVQKFGMDAAQEDGPKVIALMFGEGKSKVSDIPEDQDSLAKAVAGVEEMLAKNPFKRAEV